LLPWLALPDGSFLSFPDAVVHRLRVPNDVSCRLSTGGALFLVHGDGSRSLMSFSSAVTTSPLPEPHDNYSASNIRKVVVSDHLVGVLSYSVSVSTRGGCEASIACSTLTMEYWAPVPGIVYNATRDIALFKGKLYILTENDELHVLEAGDQHITAACCIRKIPKVGYVHVERWHDPYATDLYYTERDYLVVSGDRLLWVRRKINIPPILPWDNGIKERTCLFEVFEAADLSSGCGRWREVDTLMGHALFVSQGCSESVSAVSGDVSTGVRQDCIYFASDNKTPYRDSPPERISASPFFDSGVYNMRDRTFAPLPLETSAASSLAARDGPWPPTWLFPET
jgi:hypothetical protein